MQREGQPVCGEAARLQAPTQAPNILAPGLIAPSKPPQGLFFTALCASLAALALLVLPEVKAAAPESGPKWDALSVQQREALAPLQATWPSTEAARKRKWLQVAASYSKMPQSERARVHERMSQWAALSPAQRAQARIQFQETRQLGPEERQARWREYQALPETEKARLAQSARPSMGQGGVGTGGTGGAGGNGAQAAASKPGGAVAQPGALPVALGPSSKASEALKPKRNVVAAAPAAKPRPVAPTVVQAKPGATTTTMDQKVEPPAHHQPGLPKIAATPPFVDPQTLLPRRGAQAAAMRAPAQKAPSANPEPATAPVRQ